MPDGECSTVASLYLSEQDVAALLTPKDALAAVEESFLRLARGSVDNRPRERLPLDEGQFAVMACVDPELGYAGLKSYAWTGPGRRSSSCSSPSSLPRASPR